MRAAVVGPVGFGLWCFIFVPPALLPLFSWSESVRRILWARFHDLLLSPLLPVFPFEGLWAVLCGVSVSHGADLCLSGRLLVWFSCSDFLMVWSSL